MGDGDLGQGELMSTPIPPEVTEIKRLTIRPGDRIIITCDKPLDEYEHETIRDRCREILALPDDIPLLVLPGGMDLKVAGPERLSPVSLQEEIE